MQEEGGPRYSTMIRDLPHGERPRERLRELGPASLSNAELIAILLRTGLAGESVLNLSARLLSQVGGLAGMARASYGELCSLNGVSDAKACQLLASLGVATAGQMPPSIGWSSSAFAMTSAQGNTCNAGRGRA